MPNLNVGLLTTMPVYAGTFDDYPNAESCWFIRDVLELYYNAVVLGNISGLSYKSSYDFFYDACAKSKFQFDRDYARETFTYCILKFISGGWGTTSSYATQYFHKIDNQYATEAYKSAGNNATGGASYLMQEIPGVGISFCGARAAQCSTGQGLVGDPNDPGPFALDCGTCGVGTYASASECVACPTGGTSAAGADAITQCYATGGTDDTGTYTFVDKCYYTK